MKIKIIILSLGICFVAICAGTPHAQTADCHNGCPCRSSDKPNQCDSQYWCVDREKIELGKVETRSNGARLFIEVSVTYHEPECSRQFNLRPYTDTGVFLYITAREQPDDPPEGEAPPLIDLGTYNVAKNSDDDGDPWKSDLNLPDDMRLHGPTQLVINREKSSFEKRYFQTQNEGILISDIQSTPPGKSRYADIVLLQTDENNRPTGRQTLLLEGETHNLILGTHTYVYRYKTPGGQFVEGPHEQGQYPEGFRNELKLPEGTEVELYLDERAFIFEANVHKIPFEKEGEDPKFFSRGWTHTSERFEGFIYSKHPSGIELTDEERHAILAEELKKDRVF